MSHGKQKGKVDSQFTKRIDDLEEKAKKCSESFKSMDTFRPWHVPKELGDPLDVPSLHNPAWERNAINQLYSETILAGPGKEGGTCGDLIAMKWQADFMAVEERAFRTRHASFARCASLAHGRLDGHGTATVGIFSFLKDGIQSQIDAGGVTG
jgi:hypothetical protein